MLYQAAQAHRFSHAQWTVERSGGSQYLYDAAWHCCSRLHVHVEQLQALSGPVEAGPGKLQVGASLIQGWPHCSLRPQNVGLQNQADPFWRLP